MINNRQNGRRRGRGGQQARNGQPGGPNNGGSRLDNRARGNAAQLLEKYKTLARDAQMQGDRVATEYYLQFADHYFRVLAENRSRFEEQRPRPQGDFREEYGDEGDGEGANEVQARNYDRRNDGEDSAEAWDDGEQPQREPQREIAQREGRREQPQRESRVREDRPRREDREPRGERSYRNGNGNGANGNYAPAEELSADALPPRIELDRLPPAITEVSETGEAPVDEAPRRTRRPRKPRETAPVEA